MNRKTKAPRKAADAIPAPITISGYVLQDGDETLLERTRLAAALLARIDRPTSYALAVQAEEMAAIAQGIEDWITAVLAGGHWLAEIPVPDAQRMGGAA